MGNFLEKHTLIKAISTTHQLTDAPFINYIYQMIGFQIYKAQMCE